MKTFYVVTFFCFVVGMLIVCFYAPWTAPLAGNPSAPSPLGYAPVWSSHFSRVPGAHIERSAFEILTAIIAFFSITIGGAAFFFRNKRGSERDL